MSSKVDASGSSSMGDVHMMFHMGSGAGSWGQRKEKLGERSSARLRLSGLGAEVSEEQVKDFFSRFYSTVDGVQLERSGGQSRGHGFVSFRFGGERDKAVIELQGRELQGYPLSLSKAAAAAPRPSANAAAASPARGPPLTDEQIFSLLLRRETARAHRDFKAADGLRDALRHNGVLVDETERTWRTDDGRGGLLPPRQAAPASGAWLGGGGGSVGVSNFGVSNFGVSKFDEARTLCAPLGDESYGTQTLARILSPFRVESVTSTRDGYAACLFPDAQSATAALGVGHYTPTGNRIGLVAARNLRLSREAAAQASAASAYGGQGAHTVFGGYWTPMEGGWVAEWSSQHGCFYYTHPSRGLTQWEPPGGGAMGGAAAVGGGGLVDYSDDEEEEKEEGNGDATNIALSSNNQTPSGAEVVVGATLSGLPTAAGVATGTVPSFAPAPAGVAASTTGTSPSCFLSASAAGHPDPEFFYGDMTGSVQGPFPLSVMRMWVVQGALPAGTPACAVGGEQFTPLSDMPEFQVAFQRLAGQVGQVGGSRVEEVEEVTPAGGIAEFHTAFQRSAGEARGSSVEKVAPVSGMPNTALQRLFGGAGQANVGAGAAGAELEERLGALVAATAGAGNGRQVHGLAAVVTNAEEEKAGKGSKAGKGKVAEAGAAAQATAGAGAVQRRVAEAGAEEEKATAQPKAAAAPAKTAQPKAAEEKAAAQAARATAAEATNETTQAKDVTQAQAAEATAEAETKAAGVVQATAEAKETEHQAMSTAEEKETGDELKSAAGSASTPRSKPTAKAAVAFELPVEAPEAAKLSKRGRDAAATAANPTIEAPPAASLAPVEAPAATKPAKRGRAAAAPTAVAAPQEAATEAATGAAKGGRATAGAAPAKRGGAAAAPTAVADLAEAATEAVSAPAKRGRDAAATAAAAKPQEVATEAATEAAVDTAGGAEEATKPANRGRGGKKGAEEVAAAPATAPAAAALAQANGGAAGQAEAVSESSLKTLKVAELRARCDSLGLDATGVKAVLIKRILQAL
jgi:hypothetical protein